MKAIKIISTLLVLSLLSLGIYTVYAQNGNDQTDQSSAPVTEMSTPTNTNGSNTNAMPSNSMNNNSSMAEKNSVSDLKMGMRKLWEDHIVYTRNFIISSLSNLKDLDTVTQRLLKNQDDIGDAIKPYYGNDAGSQLSKLLREHIMIAAQVVKAAKTNNKAALEKAQKEWTANAIEIATFLSNANPNWNKDDLQANLQMHLDLTSKETAARINKNWTEDIAAYDDNHDHMLKFSDTLVEGIAKQYPDKVSQ